MSAPDSSKAPGGFFTRLLALVAGPEPADAVAGAVIAPELPGELFLVSEPEKDAAVAKSNGA